jgi:hypothetical protein
MVRNGLTDGNMQIHDGPKQFDHSGHHADGGEGPSRQPGQEGTGMGRENCLSRQRRVGRPEEKPVTALVRQKSKREL